MNRVVLIFLMSLFVLFNCSKSNAATATTIASVSHSTTQSEDTNYFITPDYPFTEITNWQGIDIATISTNSYGEFVVEDWDTFFKLFKIAINNRNKELLKRLTHGDITIHYQRYEGSSIFASDARFNPNKQNKLWLKHVNFELIGKLISNDGTYESHEYNGRLIQEYFFPYKIVSGEGFTIIFRNSGKGLGWELSAIMYLEDD